MSLHPEFVALSACLEELQGRLSREFGMPRLLVGGASSLAVLDHIWSGTPLDIRDVDVYAVRGHNMAAAEAQAMGESLASETLGALEHGCVTPHMRANPSLPRSMRGAYQAGWGFNLIRGDRILDVTVYNGESDILLNGLFDIDRVKIDLSAHSLARLAEEHPSSSSYTDLCRQNVILDPQGGYPAWRRGRPTLVNRLDIEQAPIVQSIRIARTFGKLSYKALPRPVSAYLRQEIRRNTQVDSGRFQTNLRKLLADEHAAVELAMLRQAGVPASLLSFSS